MMAIAIIPARGGSKGIPGKNIIPVCGKPLIAWTIEQSRHEGLETIVATDSDDIARVATRWGAHVWWRSPETATDTATTESVLCEVVSKRLDVKPDEPIVLLQCTSPIRQTGEIQQTVRMLREYDSVFSARKVEGYTWTRMQAGVEPSYGHRQPRQKEIHETIEENGSIYACRASGLLREQNRIHGKVGIHMMHPLDSFQIDEWQDIPLIESLMPIRIPGQCR